MTLQNPLVVLSEHPNGWTTFPMIDNLLLISKSIDLLVTKRTLSISRSLHSLINWAAEGTAIVVVDSARRSESVVTERADYVLFINFFLSTSGIRPALRFAPLAGAGLEDLDLRRFLGLFSPFKCPA